LNAVDPELESVWFQTLLLNGSNCDATLRKFPHQSAAHLMHGLVREGVGAAAAATNSKVQQTETGEEKGGGGAEGIPS
jgi:hypothetical protein